MAHQVAGAPAERVVVDIGNTRIKWGLLDSDDRLADTGSMIHGGQDENRVEWLVELERCGVSARTRWAIASVNPLVAERFARVVAEFGGAAPAWYRSASDVPMPTMVREPSRAGADRALGALAAWALAGECGPGLVISCGTALTVDRINADGVWEGGAIAPGMGLAARVLNQGTAQVPWINRLLPGSHLGEGDDEIECGSVAAWGRASETAVKAGVFWGTVGAARELIARQGNDGWRIWTGGDALPIADEVEGKDGDPWIVRYLVLTGLAMTAFGASAQLIVK